MTVLMDKLYRITREARSLKRSYGVRSVLCRYKNRLILYLRREEIVVLVVIWKGVCM